MVPLPAARDADQGARERPARAPGRHRAAPRFGPARRSRDTALTGAGRHAGSLCVMTAAVLWGTIGIAQALSPYDGSPVGLAAARMGTAGLALLALSLVLPGQSVGGLLRPGSRRHLMLGALATAAYQASYFIALQQAGVAVGTLISVGSAPVAAGLIGTISGHRPTRRWSAATAVAVTGLALLIVPGGDPRVRPAGVLAALIAGASFAVYSWCSRRSLDAGVPPIPLLAWLFAAGSALLLPFAWRDAAGWLIDPGGLAAVCYLALVATVLPYVIWIRGIATTAPAVAATLALTEPLAAAGLGVVVLGEPLTASLGIGAGLLVVGLAVTVTGRHARPCGPAPQ